MIPPVSSTITIVDPIAALCRMPNGCWAAEIAPGRLLTARTKEEALGFYMFEMIERLGGRKFDDEQFRLFDFGAHVAKKGGGA